MIEKRREKRTDVRWPVLVAGISGSGEGRTIDASLCGLLFETDADLETDQLVTVRIALDANTSIECAVQILRTINAYAAEIRYISAADRQRLSFALMLANEGAVSSGMSSG
jgi:hypothetical protein